MADLPVVNALNEGFENQSNVIKDSISRLQSSIRTGLALNRAEIGNLNETIMRAFNINEQMLELEKEKMRIENERYLEQQRKKDSGTTAASKPSLKGDGSLLSTLGIIAGIAGAISAFTSALTVALVAEGVKYQKMFNKAFAKAFRPIGKLFTNIIKFVDTRFPAIRNFFTNIVKRFTDLRKTTTGSMLNVGKSVRSFIAGIVMQFQNLGNTVKGLLGQGGQAVKPIVDFATGVIGRIKSFFNFVFEPLRSATRGLDTAADTVKSSASVISRIGGAVRGFFAPFQAAVGAFQPVIKVAKGLATTIGRVFFPLTIIMAAFDVISETIAGFQEGGIMEGLKRGFTALLDATIFLIPNMLKDVVSFVADLFGFEKVSEFLDQMSIGELVMDILSMPIKALGSVGKKIGKYFGLIDEETEEAEKEEKTKWDKIQEKRERNRERVRRANESQAEREQRLEQAKIENQKKQTDDSAKTVKELSAEKEKADAEVRAAQAEYNKLQRVGNQRLLAGDTEGAKTAQEQRRIQLERMRSASNRSSILGAEIDERSRNGVGAGSGSVNVTAPQTSVSNNNTNVNKTTVAPASPRRNRPSPQAREMQDPLWVG